VLKDSYTMKTDLYPTNAMYSVTHLQYPLIVAVVLNWNNYDDTYQCLNSLCGAEYPNLKIVIVDNASSDGSRERLNFKFRDITLINLSENMGYAVGNNVGIRWALEHHADYILILNNDIVVSPKAITTLAEIAERQKDVGIVTGLIKYKADPCDIYYAAGSFSRIRCTGINVNKTNKKYFSGVSCDVSFVNGSYFLVRSEAILKCGMLDESYFMYFEDLEFSRRMRSFYRMVYTPSSIVYHKSGAGKGIHTYTETYLYYHTRNRIWVFRNESFIYKVYVVVFTTANSVIKSLIFLLHYDRGNMKTFKNLKAMWCGWMDGLIKKANKNITFQQ
jgi:GT2 family glycosyltransferase